MNFKKILHFEKKHLTKEVFSGGRLQLVKLNVIKDLLKDMRKLKRELNQ